MVVMADDPDGGQAGAAEAARDGASAAAQASPPEATQVLPNGTGPGDGDGQPEAGPATESGNTSAGDASSGAEPGEVTQPLPNGDPRSVPDDPGATATQPIARDRAATQPMAGDLAGTRPISPTGAGADRWSARAGIPAQGSPVRPPLPYGYRDEELIEDPYAGRSWFAPVLISLIALILLTILSFGVWLIYQSSRGGPAPAVTLSATPASPAPATAPATTAAPTTAPPSSAAPPPTTPAVTQVEVPNVVGTPERNARQQLAALGLNVEVNYVIQPGADPGTVVRMNPPAGTMVDKGSTVTLVVAAKGPSASSQAPTGSPSVAG